MFLEVLFEVSALGGSEFIRPKLSDSVFTQPREDLFIEDSILPRDKLTGSLANRIQLLGGGESSVVPHFFALVFEELESADSDHHELIQIGGRYG